MPQWIGHAAACWSLLHSALGWYWTLGGAGFPFGGANDDTALAAARAATAGPVIAAVSLAGGMLPLVLIGAPFGWPPELSLGEFFASMYPWPVINELLLILGGLLWAAATLALPPAPPRPLPPLPPIMNAVN